MCAVMCYKFVVGLILLVLLQSIFTSCNFFCFSPIVGIARCMKLLFAHEIATDILEYTQLLNINSPFLENLVSMCVYSFFVVP
jgi:uncharacterized membrane protein